MSRLEVLLYRLLMLAFPRRVRRDFGEDMQRMFADQVAEARRQGHSAVRVWLEAAADAFQHGMSERWAPLWRSLWPYKPPSLSCCDGAAVFKLCRSPPS